MQPLQAARHLVTIPSWVTYVELDLRTSKDGWLDLVGNPD